MKKGTLVKIKPKIPVTLPSSAAKSKAMIDHIFRPVWASPLSKLKNSRIASPGTWKKSMATSMDPRFASHNPGLNWIILRITFQAGSALAVGVSVAVAVVIGILASRAVDRFHKPIIIFSDDVKDENNLKGSGRSIEGVNLYTMLGKCAQSIIQFGGHAMAAGLSIEKSNLESFIHNFNKVIPDGSDLPKTVARNLTVDYCSKPEEILNSTFLQKP